MADTNETTNTTETTTQAEQQNKGNESTAVGSVNTETTNTNVGTETKATEKMFTQEDIDKIITKRLEREKTKAIEEKQEAEKLATMSAEEKARFELDKQKADFEKERSTFQKQKMELEITKQLNTEGLPVNFAKYLMADDAQSALTNINAFKEQWINALETEVNKRLKGTTPKSGGATNTGYTLEDMKGMSIEEINKNWANMSK